MQGFLVWLKYVPGISFETDNGPFKVIVLHLLSNLSPFAIYMYCICPFFGSYFLLVLQMAMQEYTKMVVDTMKSEKLFESQGGTIILRPIILLRYDFCFGLLFSFFDF